MFRHGATANRGFSPEYRAWRNAKRRCYNVNHDKYKYYGGRGITMCDEWRSDFAAFLRDLGLKPTPKHEIERVDTDGPYAPWNCRWATRKEQMQNRRPYENPKARLSLSGLRFGRLLVKDLAEIRTPSKRRQMTFWNCLCDCGATVVVQGTSLKHGLTKSCGCLRREVSSARMKRIGGHLARTAAAARRSQRG